MMPQKRASEAELWQAHLAVLAEGVRRGGPEGIARVRSERVRLEREVEAMNAWRKLAARALGADGSTTIVDQLSATIADRLRRVSDLAGLLRQMGAGGRVNADGTRVDGPSAEAAVKPARIDPI